MHKKITSNSHLQKTIAPCIDVAVALPVFGTYTYQVPQSLIHLATVGRRVLVPFGRRSITGYILGSPKRPVPEKLKFILDILDEKPLFPSSMLPFFKWISDYYLHPIGEVIRSALPGGLNVFDMLTLTLTVQGRRALHRKSGTPMEKMVLKHLLKGPCSSKNLNRHLKTEVPRAVIHNLERSGWVLKTRELKQGRAKPMTHRFVSLVRSDIPDDRFYTARKQIMDLLESHDGISLKKLKSTLPGHTGYLNFLKDGGYIAVTSKQVYRDPLGDPVSPDQPPELTPAQQHVIATVRESIGKEFITYLLAGVTGSGKTEVYMHLAAEVIKTGRSVLVLVPEIALISQTERCFRGRFGECVAVLHSGLSTGERYDQWRKIMDHKASIVIGARSAIFSPLKHIGLIVVDEEHDTSYKQDGGLRYNAKDLAVVRAKLNGCIAILGSATPSLQSIYNVYTGKFRQVSLTRRIRQMPMPKVDIVDLRKNRDSRGIARFITPRLQTAMQETLQRGDQILLFLNRRGFASFPICAACGEGIRCKHCDITLTLHRQINAYKCHYCGYTMAATSPCPSCGSSRIKHMGLGTEKLEDWIASIFPEARVTRMDTDTTRRKGSILKILKDLNNHAIDILIGTQMVAKGHDFPGITLVGIVCADLSLGFPDFRAGEKTFQLLAQVAGRAGRGTVPGRVIMQTYNPDHFSILAAMNHDFKAFYNAEIKFRKTLNYPPFSRMIQLKLSGKDKKETGNLARDLGSLCLNLTTDFKKVFSTVEVLGPVESPITRIAKYHRWQILLKNQNIRILQKFVRQLFADNKNTLNRPGVRLAIDVDPVFML
ncbi:MAG: primosomal protein N' [Deltaproteobacteria bacterium]|nr:primosomal protein N' [Deltaproteobacteria bacterium]